MIMLAVMITMVLHIMTTTLPPEAPPPQHNDDNDDNACINDGDGDVSRQQHCHLRHCHRSIGQEGAECESREHGQEGGKVLRRKK